MARRKKLSSNIIQEIWAVAFISMGVLLLLALSGNLGDAGKWLNLFSLNLFGVGAWLFPFTLIAVGTALFLNRLIKWSIYSLLGIFLIFFSIEGLLHVSGVPRELMSAPVHSGGGMFGVASSVLFRVLFGDLGTSILLSTILVIGSLIAFQISLSDIFLSLWKGICFLFEPSEKPKQKKKGGKLIAKKEKATEKIDIVEEEEKTLSTKERTLFEIKRGETPAQNDDKPLFEKQKSVPQKEEKPMVRPEDQDFSSWEKPTLSLLENGTSNVHVPDKQLHDIGTKIVEKLAHFKVGVSMDSAFVGPTVTQFALQPDETVKLNKITSLKSELALALSAESVRIEAPIPGKNLVGIEIPNIKRSTVLMKEILKSTAFTDADGSLRLCLGKDVSGQAVVESLDEMPHLLIAGSTGSGKSVGMNAFLISMLFENSPADLRFIMVDPKRVELMPYEGIPHLLTPVITDASKALSALRWCVSEMMRRLDEFSKVGARNISEYNASMKERAEKQAKKKGDDADQKEWKTIPKIVIVIDELADLMMREHKKETEAMICRIAQMARAVGMHLIIATQRPSVDVITGLIKANIPTRIAFTVTSSIDSRTVLDSIGAEDLLGKGDMLFTNPRLPKPKRIQGIYISGKEIEKVVRHLKIRISDDSFFEDHISLDDAPDTVDVPGFNPKQNSGDGDTMLQEAVEVVRSSGKASASLLQRRLSVGYARAARILDEMEEAGFIGPSKGAKPRDIFL